MISGKTKISTKDDSRKPGKVFKLLRQEVKTIAKKAITAFGKRLGAADKRLSAANLNRLRTEGNRPAVGDYQDN